METTQNWLHSLGPGRFVCRSMGLETDWWPPSLPSRTLEVGYTAQRGPDTLLFRHLGVQTTLIVVLEIYFPNN